MSSAFIEAVKFIIQNSPFGLLQQIDTWLRKINSALIDQNLEAYTNILKMKEEECFRQIPYGVSSAIISGYNKEGDNYVCQIKTDKTKKEHIKFKMNPLSDNLPNIENIEINSSLRDKLSNAIEKYIDEYYPSNTLGKLISDLKKNNNSSNSSTFSQLSNITRNEANLNDKLDSEKTAFYVSLSPNKKFEAYIIISSHHILFSNNQTAKWISLYKINSDNNKDYKISGWVKISNYYCENENNSHFNLEENLEEKTIQNSFEDIFCNKVVEIIKNFENDIEERLYDLFGNFNEDVMKALRRNVTVTGTKMDWNIDNPSFSSLKD